MPEASRNYVSCSDMDDRRALSISNKNGLEIGSPTKPDGFCHQRPGTSLGYCPSGLDDRKFYTQGVVYNVIFQLNMEEIQHLLS